MANIELISPNGHIVGMLLEDGSVCPFTYSSDGNTSIYKLKADLRTSDPVVVDDKNILVDCSGRKWDTLGIELYTATREKSFLLNEY